MPGPGIVPPGVGMVPPGVGMVAPGVGIVPPGVGMAPPGAVPVVGITAGPIGAPPGPPIVMPLVIGGGGGGGENVFHPMKIAATIPTAASAAGTTHFGRSILR